MPQKIAVVGAGVIGLTTALMLTRQGRQVEVFSSQDPLYTTSTVAGAIWIPFKVEPHDKVLEWARNSIEVFKNYANIKDSGVSWSNYTEFFPEEIIRPDWMNLLKEGVVPQCQQQIDLPCYFSLKLPVIDTPKHIAYLLKEFQQAGGQLHLRTLSSLSELSYFEGIINCSGVGARELAGDEQVYPIKGQTFALSLPAIPIQETIFIENHKEYTLIIPHHDRIVLGISVIENSLSTDYDYEIEAEILARARKIFPQLADSKVIDRRVGFRPGRIGGVRLEREDLPQGQFIIHNYGHGGAGITLAPGCAQEVLNLQRRSR